MLISDTQLATYLIPFIQDQSHFNLQGRFAYQSDEDKKRILKNLFTFLPSNIKTINLAINSFDLEAITLIAEFLKVNKSITSIDLSNNKLNVAEFAIIAQALEINNTLTSINLSSNWVGEDGFFEIAKALKINKSLTSINLSKNGVGPKALKAIAKALEINDSLTSINLSHNWAGKAGIKAILESLLKNKAINWIDLSQQKIAQELWPEIVNFLHQHSLITFMDLQCYEASPKAEIKAALAKNKSFLAATIKKLSLTKPLSKAEILTLKSHYHDNLFTDNEFKKYANTLQNHLNTLELSNEPMTKALRGFNGASNEDSNFLSILATYLNIYEFANLALAFSIENPRLKLPNVEEKALPALFFSSTGLEESDVVVAYEIEKLIHSDTNFFAHSNLMLKCAETFLDTLKLVNNPSYENLYNLVVDANHLCGIYYGSNVYFMVIIAADALKKAAQGEYLEATKSAAVSVASLSASYFLMEYEVVSYVLPNFLTLFKVHSLIEQTHEFYQELQVATSSVAELDFVGETNFNL